MKNWFRTYEVYIQTYMTGAFVGMMAALAILSFITLVTLILYSMFGTWGLIISASLCTVVAIVSSIMSLAFAIRMRKKTIRRYYE